MTPFEKLKSLSGAEQHLKPGMTLAALALNQARARLFDLIYRESDPHRHRSA